MEISRISSHIVSSGSSSRLKKLHQKRRRKRMDIVVVLLVAVVSICILAISFFARNTICRNDWRGPASKWAPWRIGRARCTAEEHGSAQIGGVLLKRGLLDHIQYFMAFQNFDCTHCQIIQNNFFPINFPIQHKIKKWILEKKIFLNIGW